MDLKAVWNELAHILSSCDDAGFNIYDSIEYARLERPELLEELERLRIDILDIWDRMRIKKVKEANNG